MLSARPFAYGAERFIYSIAIAHFLDLSPFYLSEHKKKKFNSFFKINWNSYLFQSKIFIHNKSQRNKTCDSICQPRKPKKSAESSLLQCSYLPTIPFSPSILRSILSCISILLPLSSYHGSSFPPSIQRFALCCAFGRSQRLIFAGSQNEDIG